jgi:tetratricopeptide (TPR) repeat protein
MIRALAVFIFAVCTVFATATTASAQARAVDTHAVDAARAKVAAGDSAGAIRDLEANAKAYPDDLPAARLLGDLYFRIPDYKRAEIVWKGIIARSEALRLPNDRETHSRLGSLYSAQDKVDLALSEFEKSLPNKGGYEGLVDQRRREGSLAGFEADLKTNADDHWLDSKSASFYANILHADHKFAEAQPYFQRVVSVNGNNCDALIDAGNNLIDLRRLPEALGYLERCLKIDPKNYAANIDAGEAYLEKNDSVKARPYFETALAVKPNGSEALVDIGYIEDLNNHWQEAVAYYLRAINADPLESAAYIDLGYDYNEHKLYKLAEASFIKGISIAPEDGRLHYMLAVTYNIEGKIPLAREQYRIAIKSYEPLVVKAATNELALLPAP